MKKWIVMGVALALAGAGSAGAAGTEHKKKEEAGKKAGKEVSINELNKNTSAYVDKKVTVSGEFDERLGPGVFVLDGPGLINDQIVVVTKEAMKGKEKGEQAGQMAFSKDDQLQVKGKVQKMSVVEIERGYSVDLDPMIEAQLEGSIPVIVADAKDISRMQSGEVSEMSQ